VLTDFNRGCPYGGKLIVSGWFEAPKEGSGETAGRREIQFKIQDSKFKKSARRIILPRAT
jgi:hypothetical protein